MKTITLLIALIWVSTPSYLFIGDSLTCYKNGWQDAVSKNATCTNHAKGGSRTDYMLQKLKEDLKSSSYDRVYIYGGINDAFSTVDLDSSVRNLQKCIDLCRSKNIKPVIVLGYDPSKVNVRTPYPIDLEKMCRDRYISLQQKMKGLKQAYLIIPIDTTLTRNDSDDGIHLNYAGHKKFTKWILEHNGN